MIDAGPYTDTNHEQTWLDHPKGGGAHIDVGLVPLIRNLWSFGFKSAASCEEQDTDAGDLIAWVAFASMAEVDAFDDVAGPYVTVIVTWPDDQRAAFAEYNGYDAAGAVGFRSSDLTKITSLLDPERRP